MATVIHANAMQAKLDYITTNCNAIHLVDTFTETDSRATVITNSLATTAMAGGDFSGPTPSGGDQVLTVTGKSLGTADNDSTVAELHMVLVSGSEVLHGTDVPNQTITSGNPVTFSSYTVTDKAIVQV